MVVDRVNDESEAAFDKFDDFDLVKDVDQIFFVSRLFVDQNWDGFLIFWFFIQVLK